MDNLGMEFKLKGLDEAMKTFSSKVVSKAIRYALGRSVNAIKTDVAKEVSKGYNIKQSDIRDKITVGRVEQIGKDNTIKLRIRGSRIPLGKFPLKEQGKGIAARIRKDKMVYYERGFSHQWATGTKTTKRGKIRLTKEKDAFQRVGAKAYPIWTLYGPSVPQLVGSDWMYRVVQKIFSERMQREFIHGINFYSGMVKVGGKWTPGD
jgi:hypothetical protein